MKKIILLLIIVLTLTGCHDKHKLPRKIEFSYSTKEIEVYENFTLNDFGITTNAKINMEDIKIDTSNLGKGKIEIPIIFNKNHYIYDLEYEVVDNKAPILLNITTSYAIEINNALDPCESAVFADNYDRTPTCILEGEFDNSKVGTYKLQYVIKDSSNNEVRKDLTINVVEKLDTTPPPKTEKVNLLFSDVIKNYKTDNTMIGIDVSRWQGEIDFEKVKQAGCEFVIMRMGINSDSDKDLSMDSYYLKNIKKAKEAGLLVGVYVYTTATNVNVALEHAKWAVKNLNGETLELGIAFDWENWSKFRKYNISIHDLNNTFDAFASYIKRKGYMPILYSSKSYLERIWDNKNDETVWLAHYTSQTSYKGKYYIWQMSNIGKIDGIKTDVDIDILYKDAMH